MILTAINKLEQAITLVTAQISPRGDTSKKKCQKCSSEKYWTNQCTSEDEKTPKKKNVSKTPCYLVSLLAGTTQLKHCGTWHNWYIDCTLPSWRCYKPDDEQKKFMDCHDHKKATIS
eukprot:12515806-Ditylum_brightwellii.AAC.1